MPGFIEAGAPTDDELDALLHTIIARLMKMLTRRGVLVEDMGQTYLAEPDADGEEARTLRPLQAAAITYRIAFGPRAGQKGADAARRDAAGGPGPPAAVRRHRRVQPACRGAGGSARPQALEQLCRYITRPSLSDERVQLNAAGQVALKLKTPWRDGTTHLVMSPLEFMQRLAALVPRPRLHLIRFHGVLARMLASTGQWSAAEGELRRAIALREAYDEPGSLWLAQLRWLMAECLQAEGRGAEARALRAQAARELQSTLTMQPPMLRLVAASRP